MSHKTLTDYSTSESYHNTLRQLRSFFFARNFIEVDTQSRLSILAACEDPATIATFTLSGVTWPLPQTGQMWLEHELLNNPEVPGFFCLTTSYRDEPTPNAERHLKMFPLFEFETHGDVAALEQLMADLFEYLGFGSRASYARCNYDEAANHYGVTELEAEHENRMMHDFGPICFLNNFPLYTHPFFNMKRVGNTCNKIDAILYGVETVGAAERSSDVDQMREMFHSISDGQYAQTLYRHFGKERVDRELNQFLSLNFFSRCGGGIGVNRLIRALSLAKQDGSCIMPAHTVGEQNVSALM